MYNPSVWIPVFGEEIERIIFLTGCKVSKKIGILQTKQQKKLH